MLTHLHNIPSFTGVIAGCIQVAVGMPRGLHTKARNILGRDEQPIPVDVLRHLVAGVAEGALAEGAVVRIRCNGAKQVPCDVLRTIRERNLSAVVTRQRVTLGTTGTTITLLILTEGAVELQRVVVVCAYRRHDSFGDPAVLTELAGHRILRGVRGHLALDPVLKSSLIVTGPALSRRPTECTARNLINTDCFRCFVHDLVNRVIRKVGTVDLQTLSSHITAIKSVHQVPGECALGVVLLPEGLALHLATLTGGLLRVLNRLVQLVHDLILRLLTVEETHVVHAVRANQPLRRRTLRIDRIGLRTKEAIVVTVDLLERLTIRVLSPDTNLLSLWQVRVCVKLVLLTKRIEERTHLDRVTPIRTCDRGVSRRGVTVLIHPLSVDTHTFHRNRLEVRRVRVNSHVAVTEVQHVTLDRLRVSLRGAGLDSTVLRRTRLKGVARLANRGLVNAVGVYAWVLHTVVIGVGLASFILRGCERGGCRTWCRHRLRKRRNQSKRQRGGGYRSAAATRVVVLIQNTSLQRVPNWSFSRTRAIPVGDTCNPESTCTTVRKWTPVLKDA